MTLDYVHDPNQDLNLRSEISNREYSSCCYRYAFRDQREKVKQLYPANPLSHIDGLFHPAPDAIDGSQSFKARLLL